MQSPKFYINSAHHWQAVQDSRICTVRKERQNRTHRAGLPWPGCQKRTGKTELPRTGQPKQDNSSGKAALNRLDRTARTGHDCQGRTAWTGQLEPNRQNGTARTEQQGRKVRRIIKRGQSGPDSRNIIDRARQAVPRIGTTGQVQYDRNNRRHREKVLLILEFLLNFLRQDS